MNSEAINQLLLARIRDLANRRSAGSPDHHRQRVEADRSVLMKSLGLEPLPPHPDLNLQSRLLLQKPGYSVEGLSYESRPGLLVTAHLYCPEGAGPFPLILRPHGQWVGKKMEPLVQASAIGLALAGFAVLVVDSPGQPPEDTVLDERAVLGRQDNAWLHMGSSVAGVYAWDLIRGLDALQGDARVDLTKVGITGEDDGALVSAVAFALDERIGCAAVVCWAASLETAPVSGLRIPGQMALGDRSDLLALRAPSPVMIVCASEDLEYPLAACEKSFQKLKSIYKHHRQEELVRFEVVEGEHDYNRRMREGVLAFFCEHLQGQPRRTYVPEKLPLTDGKHNPAVGYTEPAEREDMLVTPTWDRQSVSMDSLLAEALLQPYPEPYDAHGRLAPWAKYGKVEFAFEGAEFRISDSDFDFESIQQDLCFALGLSVPEVVAQLIHLSAPGIPSGWETTGLNADGLTTLIASVRNLVGGKDDEAPLARVVASGPVCSMAANFLVSYRPGLEIEVDHVYENWLDILRSDQELLIQPNARYMGWPVQSKA